MENLKKSLYKITRRIDEIEEEIFADRARPMVSRAYRFIKTIYLGLVGFRKDHCLERAAGLSYATILSLIPLAVLFLSVVALVGWGQQIVTFIEDAVFPYVAPDFQNELKNIIETYISPTAFSSQTTSFLNIAGIVGLFAAALGIWVMAENVFNSIWKVKESRTYFQKMITFWLILTISPFLFLLSIYLGEILGPDSSFLIQFGQFKSFLTVFYRTIIPSFSAFAAFTVLFSFFPATRVRINSAAVGALVSLVLWEIVRKYFYLYIFRALRYTNFYKQLSTIPMFLIWIFVIWLIILLGAEISYVHQNYSFLDKRYSVKFRNPTYSIVYLGLFVLSEMYNSFREGKAIVPLYKMSEKIGVSVERLKYIAELLVKKKILVMTADEETEYIFLLDPHQIQLRKLVGDLLIADLHGELEWRDEKLVVNGEPIHTELLEKAYNSFLSRFEGKTLSRIGPQLAK